MIPKYKRFFIYIYMLFDYILNINKKRFRHNAGFCAYFRRVKLLNLKYKDIDILPELLAQSPRKEDYWITGHWFEPGDMRPRIKCLIKALLLTLKS